MKKIIEAACYIFCSLSIASNLSYPYDSVASAASIGKCYTGRFDNCVLLKLQVGLDQGFCFDQKEILDKALKIYMERAMRHRVIECAFARSQKDLPLSRDTFIEQLLEALSPLYIDDDLQMPALAFIAMYFNDPRSVGIGYVNLFNDKDKPLPSCSKRHYLHIALNKDYIGGQTDYSYKSDPEYWAGVIGHEFLHNLGFRHPTGYVGSFINEYGYCIQTDGIERDIPQGYGDREVSRSINICG